MGVKRLEDLIAFQQAVAFKREVYAIVTRHPAADRSFRYRDQLFGAASGVESNIAEGIPSLRDFVVRRSAREIVGWRGPWILQS
jgi:four helix bundle protein